VLEFNCRMGDPETQPILMRYAGDFAALMQHAAAGTLDQVEPDWDPRPALGVVLAAAGYPESPRKGDAITGLPEDTGDLHVFHAGTTLGDDDVLRTSGGRVMTVTALGGTLRDAADRAYRGATGIVFDGVQLRTDIGHCALRQHDGT
jgi:phosphoribosylamine--glycine ligase